MFLIVILAIFLASALFLTLFFVQRLYLIGRIKKLEVGESDLDTPVSVVVCAHDEEENLRKLIPLLFRQRHRVFEVVAVDDRSNDNGFDFLREQKSVYPNLKVVKVEHTPPHVNGKKYGLTLGIRAASYDKILLTDADCIPASDEWITGMVKGYDKDTQIVIGYSPYQKLKGLLNAFIRFETLMTGVQYIGAALAGRPYMGVGRNLSYRKALFIRKKGFNKHLKMTGGDDDLFINEHASGFNTRVAVGAGVNMYSVPKTALKDYITQKKRHLSVGKYYKKRHKTWIGLLALSQILFWITLLALVLYRFELYFVIGGYLVKTASFTFLMRTAGRKLGDKINLWLMPLFDFLWFIYYLILGTRALFTKKVKWN